jgi:signal transduction histidine kinase
MAPAAESGVGVAPARIHRWAGWCRTSGFPTVSAVTAFAPSTPVPRAGILRRVVTPVVAPATWMATIHVVLDFYIGTATFTIAVIGLSVTGGLICTVVLAIPALWLTLVFARVVGIFERARFGALLDVRLPDPYPRPAPSFWTRVRDRFFNLSAWKEILYAILLFPLGLIGMALVLTAWSGSIALLALPAYIDRLPDRVARLGTFDVQPGWQAWAVSAVGLAGLLVSPWISRGWAAVDTHVGRALLSRGVTAELEERVDTLETTRSWAIEVAEAERRRIERDLHDGAQQRLVALAMDLGMARQKLDSDPEAARALLDEAHDEAKRALVELRDLARGIHPVALSDRGLPGAIPAIASRCPIPTEVHVHVPIRPAASIEGMAYFIVSECLANAAKHSRATRVGVRVVQDGATLRIDITDDGVGGAHAQHGSGLRGLADRAASVDGTFQVWSPPGGPTTIRAELPCVS